MPWKFSVSDERLLNSPVSFYFVCPKDICQRPTFIASGASRFDVEQGELGDPWSVYFAPLKNKTNNHFVRNNRLLAAISSLTLTPRFLDRVVPPDQTFDLHYCGLFRSLPIWFFSYFFFFASYLHLPFRCFFFLWLKKRKASSGFLRLRVYMHNEMLVGSDNHRFPGIFIPNFFGVHPSTRRITGSLKEKKNGNVKSIVDWLNGSEGADGDEWESVLLLLLDI